MKLLVTGLNHKTAPIEIREKVAFDGPKLEEGLKGLLKSQVIEGAVILSTCNRVELYLQTMNIDSARKYVVDFLAEFHKVNLPELEKSLYMFFDEEAVRHVFRVASSLDSMVVGEPQILGQVKDAFEYALQRKYTSVLLNKLFKKAISVAKRVRTETRIAENAVSISYAAVELAKKIFTDLSEKTFMLLGAGEMAELAVRHLISNGVKDVAVANRTYERGVELANQFCGRAVRFEQFKEELVYTDIIICSTGAPTYILYKNEMQSIMKKRKHKPVFIIDISVPRNIDPEINRIDNVYLYDVDDLQGVVDANMLERKKEAEKAERIINEEVEKFMKWRDSLDAVPTIVALRNFAEQIKNAELERLMNRIGEIDERQRKLIETSINAIVNKILHPPTVALKDDREDRDVLIATIKILYGLEEETNRHNNSRFEEEK
ncbi:MAG: glutamyl-tRNA reductase [Nitrospirae bacterium]|nr:glutamyl-tRNA reductase [Nitrospirota bacterium]